MGSISPGFGLERNDALISQLNADVIAWQANLATLVAQMAAMQAFAASLNTGNYYTVAQADTLYAARALLNHSHDLAALTAGSNAQGVVDWLQASGAAFQDLKDSIIGILNRGAVNGTRSTFNVWSRGLSFPPPANLDGDTYLVQAPGRNEWLNHDWEFATFRNGAWEFDYFTEGKLAWIADENVLIANDGAGFAQVYPPVVPEANSSSSILRVELEHTDSVGTKRTKTFNSLAETSNTWNAAFPAADFTFSPGPHTINKKNWISRYDSTVGQMGFYIIQWRSETTASNSNEAGFP